MSDDVSTTSDVDEAIHPAFLKMERWVSFAALWIGGLFLIAMTMMTVTDVSLRYFFNSPIIGARDYNSLFLLVVVSFSIAYSARTGGQVAVELLDNVFSPIVDTAIKLLIHIAGAVMLAWLVFHLIVAGTEAPMLGEATLELGISYEPFYYILAFGIASYILILAAEVIELIILHRRGSSGGSSASL